MKFIGVFDGHGLNGHLMSAFAMGAMADFIQNSKRFNQTDIDEMSDAQIEKAISTCYRNVQDMTKE